MPSAHRQTLLQTTAPTRRAKGRFDGAIYDWTRVYFLTIGREFIFIWMDATKLSSGGPLNRPATFFIFFAAAAGTGFVWAGFGLGAHEG